MNKLSRLHIILLSILTLAFTQSVAAQSHTDSLTANSDSLIKELQQQLHEMKLQRIMLQEELDRSGQNAKKDSVAQAQRRKRIDSLRLVTPGAPLVIDGDTLLTLYARKGGMLADARVKVAKEKIEMVGRKITLRPDSVYVFDADITTDIMSGSEVLLSMTDMDALWQDTTRIALAEQYAQAIQAKINELHDDYGLKKKLWGVLMALLILVIQYFLIKLTNRLFRRWKFRLTRKLLNQLKIKKDYEFLDIHRQGSIIITILNILKWLLIIIQLFISIPLLFSIFPETEVLTFKLLGYIWNPFKDILAAVLNYLPNVFQIAVIYLCFHYLIKAIGYFSKEISAGRLKINGFYADWASPTYYILKWLLYSLMFVMIWPLLPNSNSEIFQGVSVFIGIIVSLGSTSIIGNIMAGMVMTYMRPFRIGDYIKVGDTVGVVIEKTVLVTRIRTRKNEIITIQNSSMLGSQTSNYTMACQNYGLIVHTKVTIGYDVPWQLVKEIMEGAALETHGIKKTPKPFMMTTSLDDSYVEYEINAYTSDAPGLSRIYSELHQNLLKHFFEAGVEIMSPHIYARRDGIDTQIPSEYLNPQQAPEES